MVQVLHKDCFSNVRKGSHVRFAHLMLFVVIMIELNDMLCRVYGIECSEGSAVKKTGHEMQCRC